MKRRFYFLLILFAALGILNREVFARNGGSNGIGFVLGDPTGISLKILDHGGPYMNLAFSWSTGTDHYFYIHGDYIFKRFNRFSIDRSFIIQPYFGIGARLKTNHNKFGIRFPLGLSHDFLDVPLDTFIEIAPIINLAPDTDFELGIGIALRFLF